MLILRWTACISTASAIVTLEFVHQVDKKDYHYIRMHDQQNIEI